MLFRSAVDVIGMARPFAVDPDVAGKLLRGELDAAPRPRVSVHMRKADALLQTAWHQQQLQRIAAGLEPDRRGAVRALASHLLAGGWNPACRGRRSAVRFEAKPAHSPQADSTAGSGR